MQICLWKNWNEGVVDEGNPGNREQKRGDYPHAASMWNSMPGAEAPLCCSLDFRGLKAPAPSAFVVSQVSKIGRHGAPGPCSLRCGCSTCFPRIIAGKYKPTCRYRSLRYDYGKRASRQFGTILRNCLQNEVHDGKPLGFLALCPAFWVSRTLKSV